MAGFLSSLSGFLAPLAGKVFSSVASKVGDDLLGGAIKDKLGIYDLPQPETAIQTMGQTGPSPVVQNIGATENKNQNMGQMNRVANKRQQIRQQRQPYNAGLRGGNSILEQTSDIFENPHRTFGQQDFNKINYGKVKNTAPDFRVNKRPYNQTIRGFDKSSFNDLQLQKKVKFNFDVDQKKQYQPAFAQQLGLNSGNNYVNQSYTSRFDENGYGAYLPKQYDPDEMEEL